MPTPLPALIRATGGWDSLDKGVCWVRAEGVHVCLQNATVGKWRQSRVSNEDTIRRLQLAPTPSAIGPMQARKELLIMPRASNNGPRFPLEEDQWHTLVLQKD